MIISYIFHLASYNLLSTVIFTRNVLYEKNILYTPYLIYTIMIIASNCFFHYCYWFIGIRITLISGLVSCMIISIIKETSRIFLPVMLDPNKYSSFRDNIFLADHQIFLNYACTFLLCFFINGPIYGISIYLLSYSKTIFRSSLFSYYNLFAKGILIYSQFFVISLDGFAIFLPMI